MCFHSSSRGFSAPEDTIIYRSPNCFMTFGSCLNAFMPWSEPIKLWISQFEGYRKWIVKNGITNSHCFPTRKNGQPIIAVNRGKFILFGPPVQGPNMRKPHVTGAKESEFSKRHREYSTRQFSFKSELEQYEEKIYLKMRS